MKAMTALQKSATQIHVVSRDGLLLLLLPLRPRMLPCCCCCCCCCSAPVPLQRCCRVLSVAARQGGKHLQSLSCKLCCPSAPLLYILSAIDVLCDIANGCPEWH
jgi:hypothetical protein